MSEPFKREDRYIVFKRADIERLPITERFALEDIKKTHDIMRASAGKPALECLVIESDWPEYEPVWKMIEDRVAGRTPATDEEESCVVCAHVALMPGEFCELCGKTGAE